MKLTSIEIHPAKSSEIAILSFRDPGAVNPYNVKSIVGLDADSIVPRHYKGSGDSSFYHLSLLNRDLVFKIGLNPRPDEYKSYSDLRDDLYRMIASSRTGKVQVQFKNGSDVIAAVSGFISKFEPTLFEKNQEVQFTVTCDEPMLKALDPIIAVLDLDPTPPDPPNSRLSIKDKKSTAPHGFSFGVWINVNISTLTLTDPDDSSWFFEIIPVGGFLTGDFLNFSSEYNNKYLSVTRGSSDIPLIETVTPGSVWPLIFPGNNEFIWTPNYVKWAQVLYYPTYWGV